MTESICVHLATGEGLFSIVDACPKLSTLDLMRCRGVSVADRRRFFEVSCECHGARILLTRPRSGKSAKSDKKHRGSAN